MLGTIAHGVSNSLYDLYSLATNMKELQYGHLIRFRVCPYTQYYVYSVLMIDVKGWLVRTTTR